jgi:CO/xanthine dehydrogenase FAD-binding subunit
MSRRSRLLGREGIRRFPRSQTCHGHRRPHGPQHGHDRRLASNDPAADYPAAVLALGFTTVVTNKPADRGGRILQGMYETALQKGEIITSVSPVPKRAAT